MLKDTIGFLKTLNPIDLLLYFAVLVLIVLIVSLIYIIKSSDEEMEDNCNDLEDLTAIVSSIEKEEAPVMKFTDFEAEQEEKAIISYEELLAKNKMGKISYEEEKQVDEDFSIKKINLDSLLEKKSVTFFNYEREEEFLKNLKALNQLLN